MSLANKFGIPQGLLDAARAALNESNEYQKKVQAHMAKKGIKSLNDLTGDQKKKFFNDLDAMHTAKHEEVESVEEASSERTVYQVLKDGKPTGDSFTHRDPEKARKSAHSYVHDNAAIKDTSRYSIVKKSATKVRGGVKINNEEVESVEEELKGDMHPDAHKVLKHIKPEHHGTYKPYLKKGTYKGDYKDRSAVLSAAEKAGHVNEEVELDEGYEKVVLNFLKKHGISASFDSGKLVVDKEDVAKAKKALAKADGFDASKLKVVSEVEEAESHQAKTTMKHISNPTAGEKKAAKDIKPGVAGYRDRVAMLKSAEARGALKKEEVELTQEDLDFIASLNEMQIDELSNSALERYVRAKDRKANYNPKVKDRFQMKKAAARVAARDDGETHATHPVPKAYHDQHAAYKKDRAELEKKHSDSYHKVKGDEDAMKKLVKKTDRGISALKKKHGITTSEDLDFFTLEQIEEFMQTEEFSQLDELSKDTLASYIKKRSHDVATQGALTRKHAMDAEAKKKEHGGYTTQAVRDLDDKSNRAFKKSWKHRENIGKAVDRLTKG